MPVIEQKTTNKNKVDFDLNRLDKSKTTIFSKYPYIIDNSMVEPPNELIDLMAYLSDNTLTAYQQRIIFLHFYHGLSIAEIAQREGVSRQNINKAKRSALDKLRKSNSI